MPNTLYQFNRESAAMKGKVRALQMLKQAVQILADEKAVELQRRGETNGSADAHYAALAAAGGFSAGDFGSANEAARKSFETLDDLIYKLTTNAPVQDVMNAINHAAAKHGVIG